VPAKELTLKDYDIGHTYTDSGICNIEDVIEESELLASYKGQPAGKMCMYQWKIEHIDHSSMKKCGVTMCGEDTGHMGICAFFKYQTIEETVDEIAERTGKDQGCTDDEMRMIVLFNDPLDIEAAEQHGCQAEEGQKKFTPTAAEL